MNCPHPRSKVVEVRRTKTRGLRRSRICSDCGKRFNTYNEPPSPNTLAKARATLRAKGYLSN